MLKKAVFIVDYTPRSLLNKLKDAGYVEVRINGSHHVLRKDGHMLITVPVHGNKDIPKGTYEKILKDAGLK